MGEPKKVEGSFEEGPGGRNCCLLSDARESPLTSAALDSVVLTPWLDYSPDLDLEHRTGTRGPPIWRWVPWFGQDETNGMLYTCRAGFIDVGHVRDNADLTLHYYRWLSNLHQKGDTFATHLFEGKVTVTGDDPSVPPDRAKMLILARTITYMESVAYEIITYWKDQPGGHHSGFSPEDLVSNYIGTYVGAKAIETMYADSEFGDVAFNRAVTAEMRRVLDLLGAVDKATALAAFQTVKGRWVKPGLIADGLNGVLLRRRNFKVRPISPWLVQGVSGCSDTTFPGEISPELPEWALDYVELEWKVPRSSRERTEEEGGGPANTPPNEVKVPGVKTKLLRKSEFERHIAHIKSNAKSRYGSDFDQR